MKNKVGLVLFGIGFMGVILMACGLDSPGETWKIPMLLMIIFALIGAIGYKIMDVEEVLAGKGITREPKKVRDRKARNREIVFRNWLTYRI